MKSSIYKLVKIVVPRLSIVMLWGGSASGAPEFSWDTIPHAIIFRSGNRISDEAVTRIANHYPLVMLEKSNQQGFDYSEEGMSDVASRLKAVNPDICNLAYWNSYYCWPSYEAGIEFYENYESWSKDELDTSSRMRLRHARAAMQEWWVRSALVLYNSPGIDGLFIDTLRSDAEPMVSTLHNQLPSDAITMGNGTDLESYWLDDFYGTYMEGWAGSAEKVVYAIDTLRDHLALEKLVLLRSGPGHTASFFPDPKPSALADRLDWVERNIDFPLAVFLMIAEENAFFHYATGVYADEGENDRMIFDTSYMEIFNNPLGAPLGDPVKSGYLYTRSFEYLDVSVNVETGVTSFEWHTPSKAYWSLDEGTGTVASDRSGNNYDGTITDGSWVTGVASNALEFNGSTSKVTLPAAAFSEITNEVSIAMWVYGDTTQPRADSVFYATDAAGNRVLNIHLPSSSSAIVWDAGNSGTAYDRISRTAATSDFMGQWNHWVFTKNATTGEMNIYLNGALWHSGTGNVQTMSGITAATLGSQISGSSYDGMIDDVQLYHVALDETDVAYLYDHNIAPVAIKQNLVTPVDTATAVTLAGFDPEGAGLTYALETSPTNGTLSGTVPNLTYTPDADYYGSDSFTFTVNDGTRDSATATVRIKVNTTPVATALTLTLPEDVPTSVTLAASDVDGDSLAYAVETSPTNGTLSGTAPDLTYTPNADYNGFDSFTYTANDGATNSATATVSITVTAVDDAPVAGAQSVSANEDGSLAIMLTGSDVDGDSLTYAVVTSPTNGTLEGTAPNLTYTPDADYTGTDSFTFVANDGEVDSAAAVVSITVIPAEASNIVFADLDKALAGNSLNVGGDTAGLVVSGAATNNNCLYSVTYSGADYDGDSINDTLTFDVLVEAFSGGSAATTLSSGNNVTGTNGTATIGTTDADVILGTNGWAVVNSSMNPGETLKFTVQNLSVSNSVAGAAVGALASGFSGTLLTEYDGGWGHQTVIGSGTGLLEARWNDSTFNLQGLDAAPLYISSAPQNSAGFATEKWQVKNVDFGIYAWVTSSVPVAEAQDVIMSEDESTAITLSGSDLDGDSLTYAVVSAPTNGTLSGTAPVLTYTPGADYYGTDSFTFVANDGTVVSIAATVGITVTAVNDAPIFSADPITGAGGMQNNAYSDSLSATDIDGDSLSYSAVSGPAWLTVASDGTLSGTPLVDDIGANSWTVDVSDGNGGTNQAVLNVTVAVDPYTPALDWSGTCHMNVPYKTVDGQELNVDIYLPDTLEPSPVVIYTHGGGWGTGDSRNVGGGYMKIVAVDLLQAGIAVVSVNYRYASEGNTMQTCVIDSKDAYRFMSQHADTYNIDKTKMAAWGDSAGAHIAMMCAVTDNDHEEFMGAAELAAYNDYVIKGCVPWYGPVSFRPEEAYLWTEAGRSLGGFSTRIFGDETDPDIQAYMQNLVSPINYMHRTTVPVYMVHGVDDTTIPIFHVDLMQDRADTVGNTGFSFQKVENAGHNFRQSGDLAINPRWQKLVELTVNKLVSFMSIPPKSDGIIEVTGAVNSTASGSSDWGTFAGTTFVADNSDGTVPGGQDLIYEITDLNLDGDATADKVVIRFNVTAGGAIQTAYGGYLSSTGNLLDADGDWLKVENVGVDVYLNNVLDAEVTAVSGLTELTVGLAGWRTGEAGTINGTRRTWTDNTERFASADNQTISLEYESDSIGDWRFLDMDFTVHVMVQLPTIEGISFDVAADEVTLTWNTTTGWFYNVYWSSNLLDGFTLIESNAVDGTFSEPAHTNAPQGFYKLTAEPAP